jgi:magnesium-transporting ATPase (P-type)
MDDRPNAPAPHPPSDPSLQDVAEVARLLGTDLAAGLGAREAADRLVRDGPNELIGAPPVPGWRKLLAQFQDPLIYLLLAAVAVSTLAWGIEGAEGWPVDSVVILGIVIANAILGFAQEARAEDAVAALGRMTAATSSVLRAGQVERIPSAGLVRGDLLVLAEGDSVGADARLVSAVSLQLSEASLTGESEPVLKDATTLPGRASLGERLDMVFKGTAVAQGVGRAVVTATGMETEMGRIARMLRATREEPTPLQKEMHRLGKMLGLAVAAIAVIVVATVFLVFGVHTLRDAVTVLLLGVSLAVAAVPEGLAAILSVVLAIGVQRMAARKAIVKKLSSVETLGSASVICSDKTGTLTRSEMTIQRIVTASGEVELTGAGYRPEGRALAGGGEITDPALLREARLVLGGGSLSGNASLRERNGEWEIQGDPTEAAFLVAAHKLEGTRERLERFERRGEIPFTSERKLMSTLQHDSESGRVALVTKGAPDVLLGRCTLLQVGERVVPLDAPRRTTAMAAVERLSAQAFRTLAVAYRPLVGSGAAAGAGPGVLEESLERELVYVGVVGIIDPPRPEAAQAVAEARRAGVRVLMITGDHPLTATRIAIDLGIVDPGATALTGLQLDRLDEAGLREAVRRTSVYARVAPEHKMAIVDALQADGQIVAMTGDGVNDAPALKSADIGVAMGMAGTEVAKEAAKMILADDNFATIVAAVREGRGIFDNIRKFLRYLLGSNMGEVFTVFFGVLFSGVIGLTGGEGAIVLPLLATQILWVNLVTDSAPALAMGVDPETDDVMARSPRRPTERVIDGRMWFGAVLIGFVMAAATLLTIDAFLPGGLIEGSQSLEVARTAGFTVLVFAQLFNAFGSRSESESAFRHLFANLWLWGSVALGLLLQVAVVQLPVLNRAFSTAPLTAMQWLACVGAASAVLWVDELRKLAWGAIHQARA